LLISGQRDSIACFDSALITPHSTKNRQDLQDLQD
jgi:hypothetical protein